MNYGMVPPPTDLNSSSPSSNRRSRFNANRNADDEKHQQYNALTNGYTLSNAPALSKKRTICDDDYFENNSDEDNREKETSTSHKSRWDNNQSKKDSYNSRHELLHVHHHDSRRHSNSQYDNENVKDDHYKHELSTKNERPEDIVKPDDEDEEDPLDAFMANIEEQAVKDKKESENKFENVTKTGEFDKGGQSGRGDIDEEDMQESYFKFMEEYSAKHFDEEEDIYEYDEDGNVIWTWKKVIDPLPSIDHSVIHYKPFNKDFYHEHEDISAMHQMQIFELRNKLDVRVYGSDPPCPVISFAYFPFDEILMKQIQRSEFEKPTPIQAQAIPAALKGRDVLGLAKTGSGKTLAYIWPAIIHIMEQEELAPGEGPIALVVVPTRELAIQVYQHAKTYCNLYNINPVCIYGGGSKYEQKLALEEGAELVICTPGRIIDMIKIGATNFYRTSFLVFDEVDRMFDLGFEPQVKSIADHVRPDRQCLMFSATMRKKVEKIVVHALHNPFKVICGDVGEANADVCQLVHVLPNIPEKWNWLNSHIVEFCTNGKLLIFVTKKADAEEVAKKLKLQRNVDLVLLHGDMLQNERNEQITAFRANIPLMVATDVVARGLDIAEIKTVVNFDVARDIDTHVHRIGRTGRAGQQGTAHTLITDADKEFAGHLVKNLESVGQTVPNELLQLALKSSWFKAEGRTSESVAPRQRLGLGYKQKDRSGFGSAKTSNHLSYLMEEPAKETSKPSISKIVERAKNIADSNTGTGLNRVQMMRSAMKSSFQSTFHKASSDEWSNAQLKPSDPTPEWRRQLQERANAINAMIEGENAVKKTEEKTGESACFGQQKKRSRWQQ